jgi:hypothetical protein
MLAVETPKTMLAATAVASTRNARVNGDLL